jgi:hypothetical protein
MLSCDCLQSEEPTFYEIYIVTKPSDQRHVPFYGSGHWSSNSRWACTAVEVNLRGSVTICCFSCMDVPLEMMVLVKGLSGAAACRLGACALQSACVIAAHLVQPGTCLLAQAWCLANARTYPNCTWASTCAAAACSSSAYSGCIKFLQATA